MGPGFGVILSDQVDGVLLDPVEPDELPEPADPPVGDGVVAGAVVLVDFDPASPDVDAPDPELSPELVLPDDELAAPSPEPLAPLAPAAAVMEAPEPEPLRLSVL